MSSRASKCQAWGMKDTKSELLGNTVPIGGKSAKQGKKPFSNELTCIYLYLSKFTVLLAGCKLIPQARFWISHRGPTRTFMPGNSESLMDQLSLSLFGWQLEFVSSHFSTLSKSWSILHLSITLTIWQADACLSSCQFARSCLCWLPNTDLVCSPSQPRRKMGVKQRKL